MIRIAVTVLEIEFRTSDGTLIHIPPGPLQIEGEGSEVTLRWERESIPEQATVPMSELLRGVAQSFIRLHMP